MVAREEQGHISTLGIYRIGEIIFAPFGPLLVWTRPTAASSGPPVELRAGAARAVREQMTTARSISLSSCARQAPAFVVPISIKSE